MEELKIIRKAYIDENFIDLIFSVNEKYCDGFVASLLSNYFNIPEDIAEKIVKEALSRIKEEFKDENRVKVFPFEFLVRICKSIDNRVLEREEIKELIKRATDVVGQEIHRMIREARKIKESQDISDWIYEKAEIFVKDNKIVVKPIK